MTPRDKLIEAMARAICVAGRMNDDDVLGGWIHWRGAAESALTALSDQGYAVVPREAKGATSFDRQYEADVASADLARPSEKQEIAYD